MLKFYSKVTSLSLKLQVINFMLLKFDMALKLKIVVIF